MVILPLVTPKLPVIMRVYVNVNKVEGLITFSVLQVLSQD